MTPSPEDYPRAARLRACGFDPGAPVIEFDETGLTLESLKDALFKHRWDDPHLLVIGERGYPHHYVLVVESVAPIWERFIPLADEGTSAGVWAAPNYCVIGTPIRTYFDGDNPTKVRALFEQPEHGPEGALRSVLVQEVKTSKDAAEPVASFNIIQI